jgi:dTMP kinase
MMKKKGTFIVIEGTDGSGKTEQFKRLVARLRRAGAATGRGVATVDFPQYDKPSSYFVREYLNGKYGGWRDVGPYRASLFYALDRFDVRPLMERHLAAGRVLVANRYLPSSMGHQGAKIAGSAERSKFFRWLYDLEYNILGIPRPDLTLILHVPAAVAQKLVDQKGSREYVGGAKRDIHEADVRHLKQAERTYRSIAKTFPRDFRLVECYEKGRLLSIAEIHERVWHIVKKIL